MADNEMAEETLLEERLEQVAADAGEMVGDGSVAATLGVAPVAPSRRAGIRASLPTFSGKLIVGLVLTIATILFAILGPLLTLDPHNSDYDAMLHPSAAHPLGTTALGYDVLAQLAQGARGSLFIGVTAGLIALVLSMLFGVVGGYLGGWTDEGLSLFTNIMLVIPGLPLVVVISSYSSHKSLWVIAVILGITGWATSAVVLRSQTKSIRGRDYVAAARVSGEKPWRIIGVEILPNLLPLIAAQFLFGIIFAILGAAGLSYLGLGPSGSITWGTILNDAQAGQALTRGAWWWFVPPGLMIALFGCGLSLINFAIDEIINPKLRNVPAAAKKVRKARRSKHERGTTTLEAGA